MTEQTTTIDSTERKISAALQIYGFFIFIFLNSGMLTSSNLCSSLTPFSFALFVSIFDQVTRELPEELRLPGNPPENDLHRYGTAGCTRRISSNLC
jgi:hypothetical protein